MTLNFFDCYFNKLSKVNMMVNYNIYINVYLPNDTRKLKNRQQFGVQILSCCGLKKRPCLV